MKKILIIFLKYFLIWLIYFVFSKILFLTYNFNLTGSLLFDEITGIFMHGFRMDLSSVSYLLIIPGIILSVSFLISPALLYRILHIYTVILLLIISFLNVLDLGLYPHWGTRVGISAFNYINDPKGIFSNVTFKDIIAAIGLFLFFVISFYMLFKRFFVKDKKSKSIPKWFVLPVMLFVTALLFIPIRGGLGTSPINLSTVSFSNKLYVNQASYNFLWNFFKTVERRKTLENPCNYTNITDALEKIKMVESESLTVDSVLFEIDKKNMPNVFLIILESFSNKVIGNLGGKYPVTPNLDSLCAEGIVFNSFYASGNRSDRGLSALLGGYPSLLSHSIINFPEKSDKLTLLSDYFNSNGYWTSFYYGGDINFYNLKSFVLQGGYNDVVTMSDFPKRIREMSSWGVPDGFLFEKVLKEVNKSQPFFTVAYTLSSHTPYDVPFKKISGLSSEDKYLNSLAYTDSCLGAFVRALKKTDYWENSLVIITSDHGALLPGPTEITKPSTYRIPMVWTGGVVKNAAIIENIGSQTDLMPTLVRQFGWEIYPTPFGRDLLSTPQYAFYMCDSGWGYITTDGEYFYDQNSAKFITYSGSAIPQPDFDFAKAYLQVLHDDFLKK